MYPRRQPNTRPPRRRRAAGRAFTLVELLVVVSILSLLIGLLVPSLGRARRIARRTLCATLLRGYATATEMYASDNNDMMMDSYKHLDPHAGIPKYWGAPTLPEDVARCPEDQITEAMGRLGVFERYDDLAVSIGSNENMLSCSARMTRNGPVAFWINRNEITGRPAKLMVWADWQNNPASDNPEYAVVKPREGAMGSLCFRHEGDVSNAAFLDGHVGPMRAEVELARNGHDLADDATWDVTGVGKLYKCYYPFGVGATQTAGDHNSRGDWPGIGL